jgi:pimeloyl-ACP methyl ester carboxylesterase
LQRRSICSTLNAVLSNSARAPVAAIAVIAAAACAGTTPAPSSPATILRDDAMVESEPGVAIAVRRVALAGRSERAPVLLIHGAGAGGVGSFDGPVPGYSLSEDLARAGHPTYVIDVRGWGRSTRPAALDEPPQASPPAVTSDAAARDIAAVVAWIRGRERRAVALVGWATGGHWAGMVAAARPDDVSHLVMLNALYGVPGPWELRARLEDPDRPGELTRSLGGYALRDASALLRNWETNIPTDDKASWRDPRVAAAYADAAITSDPTAATRDPPSVRVPSGPLHDAYLLASGTRLWNAADVRAATLIVRSELDFWSRREDIEALRRELVHARRVELVELPRATHFVFLDRPEHGRQRFVEELRAFLARD